MEFTFMMFFEDSAGQALPAGTSFSYTANNISSADISILQIGTLTLDGDGMAVFTLKHSQSITINGVAADGRIRVIESSVPMYATHKAIVLTNSFEDILTDFHKLVTIYTNVS